MQARSGQIDRGRMIFFSVGGSLGGIGSLVVSRKTVTDNVPTALAPRLGVGVAVDWLWRGARPQGHPWTAGPWGFHAELDLLDLGAYATLSSGDGRTPNIGDAISPSLTLGGAYLLERSNVVLYFGPSIALLPRPTGDGVKPSDVGDAASRDVVVGATLGAYVPIFDF